MLNLSRPGLPPARLNKKKGPARVLVLPGNAPAMVIVSQSVLLLEEQGVEDNARVGAWWPHGCCCSRNVVKRDFCRTQVSRIVAVDLKKVCEGRRSAWSRLPPSAALLRKNEYVTGSSGLSAGWGTSPTAEWTGAGRWLVAGKSEVGLSREQLLVVTPKVGTLCCPRGNFFQPFFTPQG